MRSTLTEGVASSDVAIFWDYENCHAPCSVSGYQVVSGIRNVAHKYGSVKYFKAYMEVPDANAFSRALSLRSELQSSGVSVTDCPHHGRKDVADRMITVDMLAYAIDHPLPATVILISGDRDFAYAVAILRLRRYEVIVISTLADVSLSSQASAWLDWNTHVLGNTDSSARNGCMEPSSPSPSPSTSAAQQTPTPRRASCFGESSHAGFQFEHANLSPVRSTSGPPRVSRDQREVVCAPVPADATNAPAPRPNVVDPPRGPRNASPPGGAILAPQPHVVDPPQEPGSLSPSPPGSAAPARRPNVADPPRDTTGSLNPSPRGGSIPTPRRDVVDPPRGTSPMSLSPPSGVVPTPRPNVVGPPQDTGSQNPSPPSSAVTTPRPSFVDPPRETSPLSPSLPGSATPTRRPNVVDPPRDTTGPPNSSPPGSAISAPRPSFVDPPRETSPLPSLPGSAISTPRPSFVDPPQDASPLNLSPPRSAPEAEAEQTPLASPVRLLSETSLPSENDIPPRPSLAPADLARALSSNPGSPGVADSTLLFPSLRRVQSLDHDVPVTILSSSPPAAEDSSVLGGDDIPVPKTPAMASPLIGVSTAAQIHNWSQTVLDASRPTVLATPPNNFARAERSPSLAATSTGLSTPLLSRSSTSIPTRTVPNRAAFQPLIAVLEKHRAQGVMRPFRSTIGQELAAHSQKVYKDTGTQGFRQLAALAEKAGIIQLGRTGVQDWISLCATGPRRTGALAPAHARSPTRAAANPQRNKVPPALQPLVDVLLRYRAAGVPRPSWSVLGAELSKPVYSRAGVNSFKKYAALAEQARLVETGGVEGSAWISLLRI